MTTNKGEVIDREGKITGHRGFPAAFLINGINFPEKAEYFKKYKKVQMRKTVP